MTFLLFVFIAIALETAYNPSGNVWVGLLLFMMLDVVIQFFSIRTEVITVKSKRVKKSGFFKVSQYIIKTTDGREFFNINDDCFLKFNAKKLQSQIKVGKTYQVKTYKIALGNKCNILSVCEVKSSVRRKSGKKLK